MALKPLTPGVLPIGVYDLLDTASAVVGGEIGVLTTDESGDYYAADAGGANISEDVKVTLGRPAAGEFYGLVDDGTTGYGTSFGTIIGATVGQGTGFLSGAVSSSAKNTVVVGPSTTLGSGKVTLWTMPGLYGVTGDAFTGTAPSTVNTKLYADSSTGLMTTSSGGPQVCVFLNKVFDSSLVSTSAAVASGTALDTPEYYAVYLLGVSAA